MIIFCEGLQLKEIPPKTGVQYPELTNLDMDVSLFSALYSYLLTVTVFFFKIIISC